MWKKFLSTLVIFLSFLIQNIMAQEIELDSSLQLLNKNLTIGSTIAGDTINVFYPNKKIKGQQKQVQQVNSNLETNDKRDIIVLRDKTNAILIAHSFNQEQKLTLGAETTASSLVLFHPSLLGLSVEQQQKLIPIIENQPSFTLVVNRIKNNIQIDSETPLSYLIHPLLQDAVQQLVDEVIQTYKFDTIVVSNIKKKQKKLKKIQMSKSINRELFNGEVRRDGFILSCQNDKNVVITDCNKATKLQITNSKAIYYGVYIDDKRQSEILDAKEGLVNISTSLYPPKFDVETTKENTFSLSDFGTVNNNEYYNINLTRKYSLDPTTAEGYTTWMNSIKGLSIFVEMIATSPKNNSSKISNWIKKHSDKLKKISDSINPERAKKSIKTIKTFEIISGTIHKALPNNHKYKEAVGEIHSILKKMANIGEKAIDLLKLDPIRESELNINRTISNIFGVEDMEKLKTTLKDDTKGVYEKLKKQFIDEAQNEFSTLILNNEFPFNYDYVLQKLSAYYNKLDKEKVIDDLLKVIINDMTDNTVKAVANIVYSNMFGLPFKIAKVGNKLVPFAYDMYYAPESIHFPLNKGLLKYIPEAKVSSFTIKDQQNKVIYHYDKEHNSTNSVNIEAGECVDISYEIDMPNNFERGIDELNNGWTCYDDTIVKVPHFKAVLREMYQKNKWAKPITRSKLLEQELKIHTKCDMTLGIGIPENIWTVKTKEKEIEINKDSVEWDINYPYFKKNKIVEKDKLFCFDKDKMPSQFVLSYSNFNSESSGRFTVNVNKPNEAPKILNIMAHTDATNSHKYIFKNIKLSDDSTKIKDLKLEVDFGDGNVETFMGDKEFSHEYSSEGNYTVKINTTDERDKISKQWTFTININNNSNNFNNSISKEFPFLGNNDVEEIWIVGYIIGKFNKSSQTYFTIGTRVDNKCKLNSLSHYKIIDKSFTFDTGLTIGEKGGKYIDYVAASSSYLPNDCKIYRHNKIMKGSLHINNNNFVYINGTLNILPNNPSSGIDWNGVAAHGRYLDIENSSLEINGDLLINKEKSHSTKKNIFINNSSITVKGNFINKYTLDSKFIKSKIIIDGFFYTLKGSDFSNSTIDINGNFNNGGSIFINTNIKINGNFNDKGGIYSGAIIEIKKDFFTDTKNIDKLIISGNDIQKISTDAFIDKLEIKNKNITMPIINTGALKVDGSFLSLSNLNIMNATLMHDLEIKLFDDVPLKLTGVLDLNGHKLVIDGDLLQSKDGILKINNGKLVVKGDYNQDGYLYMNSFSDTTIDKSELAVEGNYIQNGHIYMNKSSDSIIIDGNFIMHSSAKDNNFTAGVLEVGGGFYAPTFYATGTHKVILSNSKEISIGSLGKNKTPTFNILEFNDNAWISLDEKVSIQKFIDMSKKDKQVFNFLNFNLTETNTLILSRNIEINLPKNISVNLMSLDLNLNIPMLDLNGHQLVINGNLNFNMKSNWNKDTLDIHGGELVINGDLIHEANIININGGKLIVKGDYRIQSKKSEVEYGTSSGTLIMKNTKDYILVYGDFIMGSSVSSFGNIWSHRDFYYYIYSPNFNKDYNLERLNRLKLTKANLTAGTLEVKGNFLQKKFGSSSNFNPIDTHKVILSGEGRQVVQFDNVMNISNTGQKSEQSAFNSLIIKNNTGKIIFNKFDMYRTMVYPKNYHLYTNSNFNFNMPWLKLSNNLEITVPKDKIINLNSAILDLNGYKLTLNGNFIHSGGRLFINNGQLIVNGDYRIQRKLPDGVNYEQYDLGYSSYSSGLLVMTKDKDYILVQGKFIMDAKDSYLGNGTLEIKGDFIQKSSYPEKGYSVNFYAERKHKVVLSGNKIQKIIMTKSQSNDRNILNQLILKNSMGVEFLTDIYIAKLFDHQKNPFTLADEAHSRFPDYDKDGVKDNLDSKPKDPNQSTIIIQPNQDTDKDGVVDSKDAFPKDPTEWLDSDNDGIGDNADTDDDNDGIPDSWEIEHNLNPLDSLDASKDDNGDGYSNLEIYERSINDRTLEIAIASEILKIDATGVLTTINDFGVTVDTNVTLEGFVIVNGIEKKIPSQGFTSGTHELIWKASDRFGNSTSVKQTLKIRPLLNFSINQIVKAGDSVSVEVKLSGQAVNYPVRMAYSIDKENSTVANDGSDHNATDGVIVISAGTSGSFSFKVVDNPTLNREEYADLVFSMDSVENAVKGTKVKHTVTIVSNDVVPIVEFQMKQSGTSVSKVKQNAGNVIVSIVNKYDFNQTLDFDWSQSDTRLEDLTEDIHDGSFEFDPSLLEKGMYLLRVTVSNKNNPLKKTTISRSFKIVEGNTPIRDSDGDGIEDNTDNISEQHRLAGENGASDSYVLESELGTTIKLGNIALEQEQQSASITLENLPSLPSEFSKENLEIYDFKISGMLKGKSVLIVIPQHRAIPSNATYLKTDGLEWKAFSEDENNVLYSAKGNNKGQCPIVGSESYVEGLKEGDYCLQLKIEDGGANDTDNLINGSISDPATIVSEKTHITITDNNGDDDPDDKRCFIATAAYGSYLASEVKILRDFRNKYLLTNAIGTYLVKDIYYKYSPPLANYIAQNENLRTITRWLLTPIVYGIKYPMVLIFLIFLWVFYKYRYSKIKLKSDEYLTLQ